MKIYQPTPMSTTYSLSYIFPFSFSPHEIPFLAQMQFISLIFSILTNVPLFYMIERESSKRFF